MNKRDTLHTQDIANRESSREPAAEDEPLSHDKASDERSRSVQTTTVRGDVDDDTSAPLLPLADTARLQQRWEEIQARFVDEPREVVEQADALVAEVMQQLAVAFAEARQGLETQWATGEEASTEDLRVALTRYRSFFHRLLAA